MKKALILTILITLAQNLSAQSFYCKTIGIEEGLSQSSVTSVAYDSESSLWIGTRYGLNEFRGNKVRTFMEGSEGSVPGSYIHYLHVDTTSNLWVSTDKGLSRYHTDSDSFLTQVPDIAYSALDIDGGIIFGTNRGTIRYERSTDSFERTDEVDQAYVIGIHTYRDSIIIVDRGLGVFMGNMSSPLSIPEVEGKVIMDSVLDGDILYLATFHDGLFAIDLLSHDVREYNSSNSGLTFDVILSILPVEGKLWLGTDGGGICVLDSSNGKISAFTDYYNHHTGQLPDNSVTTLYKDPHGNVWVGSVRNGLFGLKEANIKSLTAREAASTRRLSHNVVISLHEDPDGIVWIGTDGGGLNRYDPESGSVAWIRSMDGEKVVSVNDFGQDHLLVSLYSRGYWVLDKRTGKRTPFTIVDRKVNADECYNGNAPSSYRISDTKNLILAIHAYVYDRVTENFSILSWDPEHPVSGMTAVGDDGNGLVYAFSSTGLFEIDINNMHVRCIHAQDGINSASYTNGEIWYGTDAGLSVLDVHNGNTRSVETSLFSRVTQICGDSDNGMWIAADNTLFYHRNGKFSLFGENEGFAPNEILSSMASIGGDIVYLGGTKGLVEIDMDRHLTDQTQKTLKLHGVTVKGKPANLNKSRLRIPYDFSTLSVSVDLNGTDPFEKVMYRYIVNGSNSSAVETYDDYLQLHSLKAGQYEIEASYMMEDGSWSTPEFIVRFDVANPWYRSPILYWILAVLTFTGLVLIFVFIYREKVRKLKENMSAMDPIFVNRLNNYIEENLSNSELDVASMATDFAMSRAGLYNKVKNTTGKAVGEYVMEKRMNVAKALLKDSSQSITEISERVGFASPKYFSTRFKEINGCSPNAYRRQSREEK